MSDQPEYRLEQLAVILAAELRGDTQCLITGLAGLHDATASQISFVSDKRYASQLASTNAGAVVVRPELADSVPRNALVCDDPYLAFAKLSQLFDDRTPVAPGVHSSAVIAPDVCLGENVSIGAQVVIETGAVIESGVEIGAGSFIGAFSRIAKEARLAANVTCYHKVNIGQRTIIHSGAVIGADGFGFANQQGNWEKIVQLGGVQIGDDVEIGANTTIDRGALQDTVIENGVKIDNQVMVAHNVRIGQNTAIAACVGISGSTEIGSNCMIAGGVGFAGHLKICDRVFITAMSFVTGSIKQPGSYSSGTALMPTAQWKKSSVRLKQLDELVKDVKQLEKEIKKLRDQDQ